MFFKKIFYISSIVTSVFLPVLVYAETDPDFTNGVLSMPRVTTGNSLYNNVRLQLNFDTNTFSLLNAEPGSRFTSKKNGIDEILIDNVAKRTWVNGSHGCKINADAANTATNDVVTHCEALDFAGYNDWRAPSSAEISEMIINANNLKVKLNYRNPNCLFMATTDGFVKTENTNEPGKLVDSAVNSGSRCVR